MTWKTTQPVAPPRESVLESGHIRLSVRKDEADSERTWQYMIMSFGEHRKASHIECLGTWPREAIALARAELDRLEATLDR